MHVSSHVSSTELHEHIPAEARTRRYSTAIVVVAVDYAVYVFAVTAACIAPTWWLKLLAAFLASGMIGALFVVGHDAAHEVFVPSRRGNRWIARWAFFPSFTPLASWVHTHNKMHHRHLRVRGYDMVWQPWSYEEYEAQSRSRQAFYRFLRTPLGLSFYWTLQNWLPLHLFPRRETLGRRWPSFRFDRWSVVAYAIGMFVGLNLVTNVAHSWSWAEPTSPLGVFLWALVLPYFMWSFVIGFVDLVQHTHPRSIWFADSSEWDYATANLRSTTHVILPFQLNRLWHNILVHAAHHVDPRVPLYHLREAQGRLEQAYPDDVIVERFTPGFLMRLFRVCRLYDFDARQWLDYDGTPTAPAQRTSSKKDDHGSTETRRNVLSVQ